MTYTADTSSQPAPTDPQPRAQRAANTDCRVNVDGIRSDPTGGTPRSFLIPSRQADFQLSLSCDPAAIELNSLKSVRIAFRVVKKTGDDNIAIGQTQELGTYSVRRADGRIRPTQRLRPKGPYGISFNCQLDPAGLSDSHTYFLDGSYTYIKESGQESKDFAIQTNARDFKCPSAKDRRLAELDGWNALTRTYANGDDGKPSPSTALGAALGERPWYPDEINSPGRAWQAHHVVPAGEPKADPLKRLLFRCQVHPNRSENGVWLRGVELRKTPARSRRTYYSSLVAHDKRHDTRLHKRAYHGDTFDDGTTAYIGFLKGNQRLGKFFGTIEERDDCTAAVRNDVRDTLTGIGVLLGASDSSLPARVRRNSRA